jgi:hypothetical protein
MTSRDENVINATQLAVLSVGNSMNDHDTDSDLTCSQFAVIPEYDSEQFDEYIAHLEHCEYHTSIEDAMAGEQKKPNTDDLRLCISVVASTFDHSPQRYLSLTALNDLKENTKRHRCFLKRRDKINKLEFRAIGEKPVTINLSRWRLKRDTSRIIKVSRRTQSVQIWEPRAGVLLGTKLLGWNGGRIQEEKLVFNGQKLTITEDPLGRDSYSLSVHCDPAAKAITEQMADWLKPAVVILVVAFLEQWIKTGYQKLIINPILHVVQAAVLALALILPNLFSGSAVEVADHPPLAEPTDPTPTPLAAAQAAGPYAPQWAACPATAPSRRTGRAVAGAKPRGLVAGNTSPKRLNSSPTPPPPPATSGTEALESQTALVYVDNKLPRLTDDFVELAMPTPSIRLVGSREELVSRPADMRFVVIFEQEFNLLTARIELPESPGNDGQFSCPVRIWTVGPVASAEEFRRAKLGIRTAILEVLGKNRDSADSIAHKEPQGRGPSTEGPAQ